MSSCLTSLKNELKFGINLFLFTIISPGGRIDHAHHDGTAHRALTDTLALDEAVTKAISLVNTEDTLVIVTADHAHSMTMTGYPSRGNPIFGEYNECVSVTDLLEGIRSILPHHMPHPKYETFCHKYLLQIL